MDTMKVRMIMEKLELAYEKLQHIGAQPTKSNLEILLWALDAIEAAHNYLGTIQTREEDTEPEADAEEDKVDG